MKRLLLFLVAWAPASFLFAGPPGGAFIFNQNSLQPGATIYLSSGTITNFQTGTIKFNDGTLQSTAGGGGGGSTVTVKLGGANVVTNLSSLNFSTPTFKVTQSPTGTANITSMVDTTTAVVNYAYLFNGTNAVWAPQGTTFSFYVASFSDGFGGVFEIGTGVWKNAGGITFSASYGNGPATSGTVSGGGFSGLGMTNTFQGPTASTAAVSYPGVTGTVTFTLSAAGAAGSGSASITHTFNNDRFWGVSTQAGSYSQSDVTALASNDLTNAIGNTFTVTAGSGQYIVNAYPSRLGTSSYTVNGFTGGFNPPQTLSITNASGYTENYYVYRSFNANLGTTTVVVN